jgi:hypothetical protein
MSKLTGLHSVERLLLQDFDAEKEAKAFYGLFLRGHDVQKLRSDIDVSDPTVAFWRTLKTAGDLSAKVAIYRLLPLRKKTLRLFNHLVENDGRPHFA